MRDLSHLIPLLFLMQTEEAPANAGASFVPSDRREKKHSRAKRGDIFVLTEEAPANAGASFVDSEKFAEQSDYVFVLD